MTDLFFCLQFTHPCRVATIVLPLLHLNFILVRWIGEVILIIYIFTRHNLLLSYNNKKIGGPGIVLHATGSVTGAPGFPNSTPLLPNLPTVGNAPGLGGTATLNFLQPHQSFATTLLPQSTHGTDYLLDLGLSQTAFPPNSNSITLFNPVESIGAAPLSHTIYPTVIQQPSGPGSQSQSLFSTSCGLNTPISTPLFVSPSSYRPSMGGVTNLVSSTTPQMATSLVSGPGPFAQPSPCLSSLNASTAPGGFLFQTTHSHPPSQSLVTPCGSLLQSPQVSVQFYP
ncbi:unnamed protein product [Echinostoma caproni]|uniref:RunxB-like protein 2 n=1 Tax=Echinostoma caproni TaxID=27848 RepID=A0A183BFH1_9TREM|nr:unnamed protein product [Echinostoma caproni]